MLKSINPEDSITSGCFKCSHAKAARHLLKPICGERLALTGSIIIRKTKQPHSLMIRNANCEVLGQMSLCQKMSVLVQPQTCDQESDHIFHPDPEQDKQRRSPGPC